MISLGRHNILGVMVDAVDYEEAVDRVVRAAHEREGLGVSALATHGLMTGYFNSEQGYRLNDLELVLPDGQPVRHALRWLYGIRLADRVYGPTLMLKVCERACVERLPVYLYGSTPRVIRRLRGNLEKKFPNLRISGMEPSKFRCLLPIEKQEIVDRIRGSGARIVLVGLGCPRQEVWTYEYRKALSMPTLAVGAAFDFHAGTLAQAPGWMQDNGLEWLYRVVQEPARLWRRYLTTGPAFVWLLTLQALRLRRFEPRGVCPRKELNFG